MEVKDCWKCSENKHFVVLGDDYYPSLFSDPIKPGTVIMFVQGLWTDGDGGFYKDITRRRFLHAAHVLYFKECTRLKGLLDQEKERTASLEKEVKAEKELYNDLASHVGAYAHL